VITLTDAAGRSWFHQRAPEVLDCEFHELVSQKVGIDGWAMKRNHFGFSNQSAVQGGDITVAEEDFRICPQNFIIEQTQQPSRPIASAQTEDGANGRIGEGVHEVRSALMVASRQESATFPHIRGKLWFKAKLLHSGKRTVN
jgi:hypothetical protein